MKYQALEEQLDNGRRGSKAEAFGAMRACVEYWAGAEAANAVVGAFYEVGFNPEEMDVEADEKTDFNVFTVRSEELGPLSEDDRKDLSSVVTELFEKRMDSLYGIYLSISFPEDKADTMVVRLEVKGDPKVIAAAFRDKASRI